MACSSNSLKNNLEQDMDSNDKRKKGIKRTAGYKRNSIKKAKVKGLEHKNHVNKLIPARRTGQECG